MSTPSSGIRCKCEIQIIVIVHDNKNISETVSNMSYFLKAFQKHKGMLRKGPKMKKFSKAVATNQRKDFKDSILFSD